MDPLSQLLSLSFIIFSLLIGGLIWLLRTIVEFFWKSAPNNRVWEELILPILPSPIGALLAYLAPMYPYGVGFTTMSGRIAFGFVAGLLSGLIYRVIKSLLKQKLETLVPATQSPTPSSTSSASNSIPTMSADLHKRL